MYKFIQLFAYCLFIHAIISIQVFLFMNNLLVQTAKQMLISIQMVLMDDSRALSLYRSSRKMKKSSFRMTAASFA
ncbi:hypothetical protein DWW36_09080 [Erysipelotrichaceae bacterium AF15-26LB]|nr:hypothetical protein DWX45_13435 [Erysipelotrichaceae bacterium AF19-24AC]RJV89195.1 hypothetical protein DWW36_09080 [Erysipelotrichaceae bacterium AF15-26LB]